MEARCCEQGKKALRRDPKGWRLPFDLWSGFSDMDVKFCPFCGTPVDAEEWKDVERARTLDQSIS